jgi:hypothetical protein
VLFPGVNCVDVTTDAFDFQNTAKTVADLTDTIFQALSYIFGNFLAVLPKIQSQRFDGLHSIVSFRILFEQHSHKHSRFFPPSEASASPPYSKYGVFSNRKKRHNNGNNTFSRIYIRRILQLS